MITNEQRYIKRATESIQKYDSGEYNEREFVYAVATAHMLALHKSTAIAIQGKADGITDSYAKFLAVNLMGRWHSHIDESIIDAFRSYLYGEDDANTFVEYCITLLECSNKPRNIALANRIIHEYHGMFETFADTLRVNEANELAEATA